MNNLKKTLLITLISTTIFASNSYSEIIKGKYGAVEAGVSVASQKYSKGTVTNRNQPTGSINVNYVSPSYFFLNTALNKETSDPTSGISYDYEYCITPGVKNTFGATTLELSVENCIVSAQETVNLQAKLGYQVSKDATVNVNLFKESTGGFTSVDGKKKIGGNVYEVEGVYNFGSFSGAAGYLISENFLNSKHIGLSKNVSGFDFDLSYYNVAASGNRNYISRAASDNISTDHVVLTITKNF